MTTPRLTIRVRLTLLYAGLFVACGAIIVVITYALVASLPVGSPTVPAEQMKQFRAYAACMRAHGIDMSDPDLDGSMTVGGRLEHVTKAEMTADPAYLRAQEACGQELPSRSPCPMECKEAAQEGARYQRETTLAHLLRYSLITLAASTLLAVLAGWVVAGRVLRPVHKITAAALAASEHDLSARVALHGPRDELHVLANTFDTMLSRLQAAFESQRRFIANAGHELRTPLTFMRTTIDVVLAKPSPTPGELRGMAQDVRTVIGDAERLINALLTLASTERGLTVRNEVDLATVAEDVLDATERGTLRLHASLEPGTTLGDPLLLERLVANLVDNASRYNVAGGEVWLTTSTVDRKATLIVANTGPVVADDAASRLFQPFERLHGRTGSDGFGLGLAIVASITSAHHGTVTAEPRPGGGLTVTVTMPKPD
ncbi:sensor histidine kinase [Phytohabitans flavus]|uniref:sensor histidine kinase n=1 Tax=Phytohabitans flavus TaxID=1076124 RepID=UPI00362B2A75